ncbi:MAG: YggS family pyridoxal phosphate-dependent enzyme [Ignavibacteria bacterium]|nr:YggS family pyridoxal phosphate-dependent enzyme [Ignavibacteria bacterium]MBT8391951.1 YggS family pyridoxal phosphate-dependent enzyme [Ignavibacteria bacterium]NNJ52186.1 YggS family pyridoxal phosphate-dependent enzyme [Ignavibacteriaceae bacterium]NNL21771.1 YggS family pyridoxal phosphate-dependent enzyme [Ignavibacteriaceae bacterium]
MSQQSIISSVMKILDSIPSDILLVAASKTRTPEEVQAAISAGIKVIGYNYVQEAERMHQVIGNQVKWHMIGHLQRNKVKKAVKLFDMIETIDSVKLAQIVDEQCALNKKKMTVLIEINSGKESNKTGILPEDVDELILKIIDLPNLVVQGLMTMGPRFGNPEDARPYFKATKKAFDRLKNLDIPNVNIKYLSMGMSNSYKIAIEEGANIIRIGTKLFGERQCNF